MASRKSSRLDYVPKNLDAELQHAFKIANEANFSEEELELQHRKKDWVYIQKSSIDLAKRQGIEQGLEQVVMNSYRAGVKTELIAQITGLDDEKIKAIIRRNQSDEK